MSDAFVAQQGLNSIAQSLDTLSRVIALAVLSDIVMKYHPAGGPEFEAGLFEVSKRLATLGGLKEPLL